MPEPQVIHFTIHNAGAPNLQCVIEGCNQPAEWGKVTAGSVETLRLTTFCDRHKDMIYRRMWGPIILRRRDYPPDEMAD